MPTYTAPLQDMHFVMHELLKCSDHYASLPTGAEALDSLDAILEAGAKFAEQVLTPLNQIGDQQGCQLNAAGQVSTPTGFKAAYQEYVAGGWNGLSQNPDYGGQGLPPSLDMMLNEMICSANLAWGMYPGLSQGAMNALEHHGSTEQKQIYLTQLIAGTWTGTMCLTEPQCGTDLGLITTQALPSASLNNYQLTGTKIFISAGEHDLAENIIHLVLARLPKAPAGSQGLSLFLVPKFLPDAQGNPGQRNGIVCSSLEQKMGIHGNSTCTLNLEAATGFLIGQPNKGLAAMFTMMNNARLGVGIQGLGLIEVAYQNALAYAQERLQMRALSGAQAPDKPADPILVHPDVRRMLLTQKAFSEGGRALTFYTAQQVDLAQASPNPEAAATATKLLGLLTPLVKAFLTEISFEATNEALQVLGGHGYIQASGLEQFVRDARITKLYEGTTGIQALDLLGRKVLLNQGEDLRLLTKQIHKYCQQASQNEALHEFILPLIELNKEWSSLTQQLGVKALHNREEVGAAATDYLMYSGYLVLAYFWAQMAELALQHLTQPATATHSAAFYQAKLATARFYYQRLLPRTKSHAAALLSGADNLLSLPATAFGLGWAKQ